MTLNARYDGKVIVPDEPLNLPANQKLRITVEPIDSPAPAKRARQLGRQRDLVVEFAPDWDAPLPDEVWNHNKPDHE